MRRNNSVVARKKAVVSAVNLVEGGTLKVLLDCLCAAESTLGSEWDIVALVHKENLVSSSRVRCIEFPHIRRSWLSRIYAEWIGFNKLSKELKPDLWFSLHDITPRVEARRQVMYAHNPSPFYRISLREACLEPKFALFTAFYRYLYGAFIHRNEFVVVQQCWIRDAFRKRYRHSAVIVAHPVNQQPSRYSAHPASSSQRKAVFLYPALVRVFKNFEVLCAAVRALPSAVRGQIEVRITLDGTESRYAQMLTRQYGGTQGLNFIGRQSRESMQRHYAECDVVVFPSKLETWGLPISEAKALGKPLLVADLPYARETVGNYDSVSFIDVNDHVKWSQRLIDFVHGRIQYEGNQSQTPAAPYASNWSELWKKLIKDL
jgi:glycosyltransferase involved in cell wall biosynthesis